MRMFLWNLILALIWVGLWNDVSVLGFTFGFFISFIVLFLARYTIGRISYFRKAFKWMAFLLYFFRQFFWAVLRVTHDILTPRHKMRPGVLAIPIEVETELEIQVFANFISLTPGTLTLDIGRDCRCFYVHFLYIDSEDIESFRYSLKDLENRILELLR